MAGTIRVEDAQCNQIVDETKTGAILDLPLLPELAKVLKKHRRDQIANRVKRLDRGLIFPSPRAGRFLYRRVSSQAGRSRHRAIELDAAKAFNNLCRQVAAGEVVRSMTAMRKLR